MREHGPVVHQILKIKSLMSFHHPDDIDKQHKTDIQNPPAKDMKSKVNTNDKTLMSLGNLTIHLGSLRRF